VIESEATGVNRIATNASAWVSGIATNATAGAPWLARLCSMDCETERRWLVRSEAG
jgi:hypothetical protein